jgi:segregation and condensation protein B
MEMQEFDAPEPTAPETGPDDTAPTSNQPSMLVEDLLAGAVPPAFPTEDPALQAVLEAIVYVAEDPLTKAQIAAALQLPVERVESLMDQLIAEFDKPTHGVAIREVAGGYKMATKPEHHEAVRSFVKNLKPPLKLSLPALETLAVIAYKQPVTAPEIMEIRGVQGAGVLKTLLDRKLIAVAGRKNVIGKPILYKTTRDFLIQFGLKDMAELPTLKEFEEIRRMSMIDLHGPDAVEAVTTLGTDVEPLLLTDDTPAPEEQSPTAVEPEPAAPAEGEF